MTEDEEMNLLATATAEIEADVDMRKICIRCGKLHKDCKCKK